jgi:hypothetical protein
MEPNISDDLPHAVDLTLPLLRDIGWRSDAIPEPAPRQQLFRLDLQPATREVAPRP